MGFYATDSPLAPPEPGLRCRRQTARRKLSAPPKTHTPGPRLQQRGARYYSAELGRPVSRDPTARIGGLDLHAFLRDEPTRRIDLTAKAAGARASHPPSNCERIGVETYWECWLWIFEVERLHCCCYKCHPFDPLEGEWYTEAAPLIGICTAGFVYVPGISVIENCGEKPADEPCEGECVVKVPIFGLDDDERYDDCPLSG